MVITSAVLSLFNSSSIELSAENERLRFETAPLVAVLPVNIFPPDLNIKYH